MAETKGGSKLLATNSIAKTNYFLEEVVEAGLVLTGTEIKSLRAQTPNLKESFVQIKTTSKGMEAWLCHAHIAPYSHGNIWNHEPRRNRKLLLHREQIDKLHGAIEKKGKSLVPTRMYLKGGFAKVEIAIAKGKKKHDKREDQKKRSATREMQAALKKRR